MLFLVMVPVDGTPFAEHAVPVALQLARAGGGRLLLAHVHVSPPPPLSEMQGMLLTDPRVARELEDAGRAYLDDVTRRTAAHAGVPVESMLLSGDVAHVLRDAAAERGADLIVMASHDRSALGRLVSGSVAEHVAGERGRRGEPHVPVLIVRRSVEQLDAEREADPRAAADPTRLPAAPFRRMLIPLDGSTAAEAVLAPAARLAQLSGAAITLLTVHDPLRVAAELPTSPATPAYLQDVAGRLRAQGLAVDVRELTDANVAHAITQCALDVGADVLALSRRGRSAIARLLEGRVASAVLHAVLMPVLVVGVDDDARASEA